MFACISVSILFSESIFAQGSPPLLLNDPDTPGPGKWEINILTALEHSAVNDEWQIPLFDINYGLGDRCQLTVALPYVIDWDKSSGVQRGFDGMEMGIKYRFVDNSATSGSNFSFFPKVYIPFETEDGSELMFPLEWHRDWSHFGLTAEVGHIWVNGKSEGWEGGVGAALFLEPITLLGEWHTRLREAPFDLRDPMVNVGLTWEWSEAVSFFFSMGKSLHSHEEETNSWRLAGFQFRF